MSKSSETLADLIEVKPVKTYSRLVIAYYGENRAKVEVSVVSQDESISEMARSAAQLLRELIEDINNGPGTDGPRPESPDALYTGT
jgi:hypothetical protein